MRRRLFVFVEMNSLLSIILWLTLTVNGSVYVFGSILDRDLDFQSSVIHAPEALGHFPGFSQRAAGDIQPDVIPETGRLLDKSIAFPLSDRVAITTTVAGRCWAMRVRRPTVRTPCQKATGSPDQK